jgi:hypothetical protein
MSTTLQKSSTDTSNIKGKIASLDVRTGCNGVGDGQAVSGGVGLPQTGSDGAAAGEGHPRVGDYS